MSVDDVVGNPRMYTFDPTSLDHAGSRQSGYILAKGRFDELLPHVGFERIDEILTGRL